MNPRSTLCSLFSLFALALAVPLRSQTLSVTGSTTLPQDTVASYSTIAVENGGVLTIGGGSTVTVTGTLTVKAGGAVVCQGKNTSAKVNGTWAGAGVTLNAADVTIEATGSLNADGQGYTNGAGPGFDGTSRDHTWGASHGGRGFDANGSRPPVYDSPTQPVELGSAGGNYDNSSCAGGGALRLVVSNSLILNGTISANGVTRSIGSYVAGGAGGALWVTTGTLSGSGTFSANGSGGRNTGASCGGGRLAVYYANGSAFTGFSTARADAATGSNAEEGTVIFVNTSSGSNGTLRISERVRFPEDTEITYDAVQIDAGGTLEIGGGSTFKVTGALAIDAGGTVLCRGKNVDAKVAGQWAGAGVAIEAASVTIAAGGKLSADGQGYRNGAGPGISTTSPNHTYGAAFGGTGMDANGLKLPGYGDPLNPVELGSSGGIWTNETSAAGGAIKLTVSGTFTLNGTLSANGIASGTYAAGGTGGSLRVITHVLAGSGVLQADAAVPSNTNAVCSGGRIAVTYDNAQAYAAFAQASAKAGGANAEAGSIVFTDTSNQAHPHVHVFQNLRFLENASLAFDTLTVENQGLLEIGGGSTIQVAGDLTLAGNGKLLAHGKNTNAQVAGQWAGAGVTLSAKNLIIEADARLSADGQGYINGAGPGFNGASRYHTFGASYGGHGYNSDLSTPATYGDSLAPAELGSSGGIWTVQDASAGGGALKITVGETLTLAGQISANGTSSGTYTAGGCGGSLWVTAKVLAGDGTFHADASPVLNTAANSSGGRIAVYFENADTFTGFTGSSANGSAKTQASKGTVGFLDVTVPNLHLRVFERWRTDKGVSSRFGKVSLSDAASYELGGAGRLTVDGLLDLQEGSELVVEGAKEGATSGGAIHATDIVVSADSKITADGQGFVNGSGPGFNGSDRTHLYGASYGGNGYNNDGGRPGEYGSYLQPVEFGSAGGIWTSSDFAQAGGAIHLVVDRDFTLDGLLSANGLSGGSYTSGATGGSLWVEAHRLTGSGRITADAAPVRNSNARSSGGRIALYSDDDTGFTGLNQCSAAGNGAPASDGTLVSINRTTPGLGVHVTQRLGIATDAIQTFGELTLENGALLDLNGGGEIKVTGTLTLNGTSKIAVHSKNNSAQVNGAWVGRGATITAGNLIVGSAASITADGEGYPTGSGPGFNGSDGTHVYGASYGGRGISSNGSSPKVYGSALTPERLGSAGGRWTPSDTSVGGGAIRISVADTLQLDGTVSANGLSGGSYSAGGTGGSIWVTTQTLRGAGKFKADAGAALNAPAASGGGRIAIYSKDSSAFSGFTASTASRGGVTAQHGTVLFIDSDTALPTADVYQHFSVEEDATYSFEALRVHGSGDLEIGGGGLLRVENLFSLDDGTTVNVLCKGLNGGSTTGVAGGAIDAGSLTVSSGARITADGRGYGVAQGPGAPLPYSNHSDGGASYGGKGTGLRAGARYGSPELPIDPGSAGAIWTSETANGGGVIRIDVSNGLVLDGNISADGVASGTYEAGATGGSILINAASLTGNGKISAKAASSNNTPIVSGGGRVAIFTRSENAFAPDQYSVAGGGDESTRGSLYTSNGAAIRFAKPVSTFVHGLSSVAWGGVGFDRRGALFDVALSGTGINTVLAKGISETQVLSWDSSPYPDGRYELHVIARDSSGGVVAEGTRPVTLLNSLHWHTGNISADETWAKGTVHVIDGTCVLLTGVHVTVEPGAVLKFTAGSSLRVSTGAFLDLLALGTTHSIVTDIADDSAGGDSNRDANTSLPIAGTWPGIMADGGSHVNIDVTTEVRFTLATHGGTLAASETWLGNQVHYVTSDLVIPTGTTLTILPGAIVKIGAMHGIFVSSGGTLSSAGTLTQPVIFTSYRDDSQGGDTNGDGSATAPAAGDWEWIFVEGTANFEHSHILYSGGSPSGTWSGNGALRTNAAANVTFKNSVIKDAFFDGILNWGGPLRVENSLIIRADRGIAAHPGGVLDVVNTTVAGCREGVLCHGGTLTVTNSLVAFCLESGIQYDFGVLTGVSYTDVWNPASTAKNYVGTTDVTGVSGNFSKDPLFRNLARDDYHLTRLSPAIDSANGSLAPATDHGGISRYDDPKVTNTGINGFADLGAFEYADTATSNLDLAATSITGPSSVVGGTSALVSWVVTNVGSVPTSGNWHDRLSLQPAGDAAAPLVFVDEQVAPSSVLNPGQSVVVSKTVKIPYVLDGAYKWVIDVNAKEEVFEGQNHDNNRLRALTNTHLDLPVLAVGAQVNGSFSEVGSPVVYKIAPASAGPVLLGLTTDGNSGWTRLAVSKEKIPTLSEHEVLSQNWNTATPSTQITSVAGEAFYVAAYPIQLPSTPQTFTLSAQTAAFTLTGTDVASGSDRGKVSLPLHGAGLLRDASVQLKRITDGTILNSAEVRFVDGTLLVATFDLSSASSGSYDIVVAQDNTTRTLANAFTVNHQPKGELRTAVLMPPKVRAGRKYVAWIEYQNTGSTDLMLPIVGVSSTDGLALALDSEDEGAGDLSFVAVSSTGTPWILPPGASGRTPVTFTAKAGSNHLFTTVTTSESTASMNWEEARQALRPKVNLPDTWDGYWDLAAATYGTTSGGFSRWVLDAYRLWNRRTGGVSSDYAPALAYWLQNEAEHATAGVEATVVLGDGVTPASNVTVSLLNKAGEFKGTATTAADGFARFPVLGAGTYYILAEGYLPPVGGNTFTVAAHAPLLTTTWKLPAGGTLSGTVRLNGTVDTSSLSVVVEDSFKNLFVAPGVDALGRFKISGLPSGTYTATLLGDGLVPSVAGPLVVAENTIVSAGELSLIQQGTASGFVKKASSSEPLAGATVLARSSEGKTASAVTDDTGAFTITRLSPGSYQVVANASGFLGTSPLTIAVASAASSSVPDLLLTQESVLKGTVTSTGTPIGGVSVSVVNSTEVLGDGVTDTDGTYEIHGLKAGSFGIVVRATAYRRVDDTLSLTLATTTTKDFALVSAPAPKLHVRNANSSQGISGTALRITAPDGTVTYAMTNSAGDLLLGELADGSYAVSLADGSSSRTITLSGGVATGNLTFEMTIGALKGRVLAEDGLTPLSAHVALLASGKIVASKTTNVFGEYSFAGLAPGVYSLKATSESAFFTPLTNLHVAADATTVAADLVAPVSTLDVSVTGGNSNTAGVVFLSTTDDVALHGNRIVDTDVAGLARFTHLAPGTYHVFANTTSGFSDVQLVTIASGANQVSLALVPTGTLAGIVRSHDLAPSNGTRLVVVPSAGAAYAREATTRPDGSYALDGLPAGTYSVWLLAPEPTQAPEFISAVTIVANETTTLDRIYAEAQGHLQGTIATSDGSHPPLSHIQLSTTNGLVVATQDVVSNGVFSLPSVPAGSYVLSGTANGYTLTPQTLSLTDLQTVDGLTLQASWIGGFGSIATQVGAAAVPGQHALSWDFTDFDNSYLQSMYNAAASMAKRLFGEPPFKKPNLQNPFLHANLKCPCPEAYKSWNKVQYWQKYADLGWDYWHEQWEAREAEILANAGLFGVNLGKLAGSLLAASFKVPDEIGTLKSMAETARIEMKIHKISTDSFKDALLAYNNFSTQLARLESLFTNPILKNNVGTIGNLATGFIQDSYNGGPQGWAGNIQSVIETLADPTSVFADTSTMREAFDKVVGFVNNVSGIAGALNTIATNLKGTGIPFGKLFDKLGALTDLLSTVSSAYDALTSQLETWKALQALEDTYKWRLNERDYWYNICLMQIERCRQDNKCDEDPKKKPKPPSPRGGESGGDGNSSGVGSFDPNDKTSSGVGSSGYVTPGTPIYYDIHFENLATASAAAQLVTVVDSLPAELDWSTFELVSISFNGTTLTPSAGTQNYTARASVTSDPNPVDVTFTLDAATGVATWALRTVDALSGDYPEDPFAGFLPPNDSTGRGEGHVTFLVKPKASLADGTAIHNQARITFDANAPIDTPVALNTIDRSPAAASLAPLASRLGNKFVVSWTGTDSGVGVARYELWYSKDGGDFTLWSGNITTTSAIFEGSLGHTYSFYVRAFDALGQAGALQPVAQTSTTTAEGVTSSRLVNLSTRGFSGTGEKTMIAGFVISPGTNASLEKNFLVRAVGPTLGVAPFNVPGVLADPVLELFDSTGSALMTVDDWNDSENASQLASESARAGAFPLPANSRDAGFFKALPSGLYTAHVQTKGTDGVSLLEMYDTDSVSADPAKPRLLNLSGRAYVDSGSGILIAGFVINGDAPKTLLLRAVGPTLGSDPFNVPGVLADPVITLVDKNGVTVAQNDNWEDTNGTIISSTAAHVGAFPVPSGSKDAALVLTVLPGQYTLLVSGKDGGKGVAIVEIYDAD